MVTIWRIQSLSTLSIEDWDTRSYMHTYILVPVCSDPKEYSSNVCAQLSELCVEQSSLETDQGVWPSAHSRRSGAEV